MSALTGKKIILGVCGSIAAYKSALLLRELQSRGAEVRIVMTPSAAEFVTPLTFSSLSHNQVYIDMFPDREHSSAVGTWHIDLGLWADAMLVAPITASTIAKITHGIADNFLTSIVLALRAPLILAPAMDADMYIHPATASNVARLKERGVIVVEPEEGELASGLSGVGRLADVTGIVDEVERFFEGRHLDLTGRKILVTAGPTQEPIDAVRFISNRSSGKMGFAVAAAAANRGAEVKLISGPVALETPRNVARKNVSTADQMLEAVAKEIDWCDALVMTAAVADYKVLNPPDRKIKKTEFAEGTPRIELAENVDILKSLSKKKGRRVFVGFALETDDMIVNAKKKLVSKSLDLIVVNNPRVQGAGFGSDTNRVTILSEKDQEAVELPLLSKYDVAMRILDRILPLMPRS
ncbi:MAG: bifunctional phosphopantothenoylcysteine decarboxylase/phosphopantothenate--cysteine ligase CoaBC [Bacteroidetes bacterium]|nr:bifunctional phosphopantothenoylcysteine decarboxylase/phosphopantothenate--cysteine ligase CoaBC [Bacteroidota bacterium]